VIALKELVLPSGRFAAMRPITWADRIVAYGAHRDSLELVVLAIACRITKIDGEVLTQDAAVEMALEDANPIIEAVLSQMNAAFASKGVA
jgi:hypothetical protein